MMIHDTNPSRNRTFSPELDRQDAIKREAYEEAAMKTKLDDLKRPEGLGLLPTGTNRGPNRWDEITEKDFAKDYDYILMRQGSITVIDCKSEAALQWCYAHLDADGPRWGARGFAIEVNYLDPILRGMQNANLVSNEEYEYNMNAEERDRMAGEDDR